MGGFADHMVGDLPGDAQLAEQGAHLLQHAAADFTGLCGGRHRIDKNKGDKQNRDDRQ